MGIGVSLFFIALGAVLTWGVEVQNSGGFDINTIGVILMAVGGIGLLMSMLFWSSFAPFRTRGETTTVVERERELV